jgi:predicted nucleic acid-binding protein
MVVLDTSVIIKWFIEEKGSKRALIWLERHIKGTEKIVVPSLLFYEIANVLRYKKELPLSEIWKVIEYLFRLNLKIEEVNPELIMRAVLLAREKEISVYDATFVVLAVIYHILFYTADKELYEKLKEFNFVKLL